MRKLAIFSLMTLAIALSAPYFIGLKCKDEFFEKIALAKSQLPPELQDSIQITAYHGGWLTSTAQITISSPYKHFGTPDIVFESVIHHGPIIPVNHSYKLGFGSVVTSLVLPEMYQAPIRQITHNDNPLLTIVTEIKELGKEWDNHYVISSMSMPGMFQWDGLSGNLNIKMNNHRVTDLDNRLVIGVLKSEGAGFGLPNVSTSPIIYNQSLQMIADKEWKGSSSLTITSLTVDQDRGKSFQLNDLNYQLSGSVNNGLASYQSTAKLAALAVPFASPLTKISNLQETLEVNNIDISNATSGSTYSDRGANRIFKMLTKSSNLKASAGFDTNLGNAVAQLQISLTDKPATLIQINDKLVVSMSVAVAVPLADFLLSLYFPDKETSDKVIASLTGNNYLIKQDNNYYFKLDMANNKITVTKAAATDLMTFANNIAPFFANSSANVTSQTNGILQMIQGIVAATDALAQTDGSYMNKNVTEENIKALMPNNELISPWGTNVTIAAQSPTSFLIVIPGTPTDVCKQIKARMQSNDHYKIDSNTCASVGDFNVVYSNESNTMPAQTTYQTVPTAPAAR